MLKLDKSLFTKVRELSALRIPTTVCSTARKALEGFLVAIPRIKCIVEDNEGSNQHKLLVLNTKYETIEELPEAIKEYLSKEKDNLTSYSLSLTYDNLDAYQVLKEVLPHGMDIPSAFEQVGHIIHMNLRDEQLPYKNIIGSVILDKNSKRARSVVNKTSSIASQFRTFPMEILAGDSDMLVEVKESNALFKFDYSQVYWNSRLGTEHARLVNLLQPSDVVWDMFAGIGPFAIPSGVKGCCVHANDLNPFSYKYLVENIALNKVSAKVIPYNLDGREFVQLLLGKGIHFDHVFMNLPQDALSFLNVFRNVFSKDKWKGKLPRIHTHCFERTDGQEIVIKRAEGYIGCRLDRSTTFVHRVRNISPNKEMFCISFTPTFDLLKESELIDEEKKEEEKEEEEEVILRINKRPAAALVDERSNKKVKK